MSRLRRLVVSDRRFFITCRLLPLNPVKAALVTRPEDWPWSSVHDYTGNVQDRPPEPQRVVR